MTNSLRGAHVPLGLAGLTFLLAHCAGVESALGFKKAHDDDGAGASDVSGGAAATAGASSAATAGAAAAPKPDPILAFSFEASSMKLSARIHADKVQGAALFVDVFAIQNGVSRPLDCAALKNDQDAVDLSGAQPLGRVVVATVPTDASVFAGRLGGTKRTGIQGCLFDAQGGLVDQVSTSLMNAWDTDPGVAAANPRIYHGIEAYADDCIDELGELPMFQNGGTFDCITDPGMHVVPITATDASGNVVTIDEHTTGRLTSAQLSATRRCDRPAWLDYGGGGAGGDFAGQFGDDDDELVEANATQCAPFTRIGRYINSKGTRFVFICRRDVVSALMDSTFDILAFIGHNPDTGKTCFFNNHMDGTSMDGTRVPPPNTSTADSFWMDMGSIKGQGCPKCHDSDPWVHTPWIDQAIASDGHMVLPRIGEDTAYNLTTKYSIFGRESFVGDDATSQQDWAQPQHLTNVGACGSCHRIGANMTLNLFSARAVGEREAWQSWLTPAFTSFGRLHWMPTTPVTAQDWASSPNGQSMHMLDNCFDDPSSCTAEDVPN